MQERNKQSYVIFSCTHPQQTEHNFPIRKSLKNYYIGNKYGVNFIYKLVIGNNGGLARRQILIKKRKQHDINPIKKQRTNYRI